MRLLWQFSPVQKIYLIRSVKRGELEYWPPIEFLGFISTFSFPGGECAPELSVSSERVRKKANEISEIIKKGDRFLACLQKMVGALNFAQTHPMGS